MKRLLGAVVVLLVLIVAAIVIIPAMVPKETYIAQISKLAEEQTGRRFEIKGDVSVSLFPNLNLTAEQVVLGNAPGAKNADMATLDALVLDLKLMPLLSGEVAVDRFTLVKPVIHLEVDKKGKPNWEFTPKAASTDGNKQPEKAADSAPATSADKGSDDGGKDTASQDLKINLGEISLEDGEITYTDHKAGTSENVKDLDIDLSLPDLDSPLAIDGALTWKGERLNLDLNTGVLSALLAGKPTKLVVKLDSGPVDLSLDGQLTLADQIALNGDVDLDVPDIRALAAWAADPLPEDVGGKGLRNLAISGRLGFNGKKVSFDDAELTLDDIKGKGAVAVLLNNKPAITASLDVGTLDLNTYLASEEKADAPASSGGSGSSAPASSGSSGSSGQSRSQSQAQAGQWSTDPIDVSALSLLDADLSVSAEEILVQKLVIGKSSLGVVLKGGVLKANLKELNLYEGLASGTVTVNGSRKPMQIAADFDLSGLVARPFLKAAADFDRLEGTAKSSFSITASGQNQKQLVSSLNGKGQMGFYDGAIIGINLGSMARNIRSAFEGKAAEEAKTDFAELTGSFVIRNGLLTNDDLRMLAPLFRLSGKGQSSLPARTVDYRLEPKAVASLEGQGSAGDETGLLVPIIVTGPWHNLSWRPDLEALLKQEVIGKGLEQLGNGELGNALKEGLEKGLGEGVGKEILNQAIPGGTDGGAAKPEDMLKGLLGGAGQAQPQQPRPAPAPADGTAPAENTEPAPQQKQVKPEEMLRGLFGK